MQDTRGEEQVRTALAMVAEHDSSPFEKIDMLVEVAMGLQTRPRDPSDIEGAITLYEEALSLCPPDEEALRARITARLGTALQANPEEGTRSLERARRALEDALEVLRRIGSAEEIAEGEMNLGLTIQMLSGAHRAKITDAISAYQRSLRTFDRIAHPKEFAILQNNLATSFLSMPFTDARSKMREALAVQAFEEGLKVVTFVDHPTEYAMLQNNLGNALQYASTSHAVENNLRAIEAYDEALRVRTRRTTPMEYANTISNKANCLANLPDDFDHPERGNIGNLTQAIAYYSEAREIFEEGGELQKAGVVGEAIQELADELAAASRAAGGA